MTPSAGWVGSQTTLIILSNSFPIEGDYKLLWSNSATFDENSTIVIKEGTVPRGAYDLTATFAIPESTYGVNYIQFNRYGRDDPVSFQYMVKPHISVSSTSAHAGDTLKITGTGFPAGDACVLTFDSDQLNANIVPNATGSFQVNITVPQTSLGEHSIIVDAPHLNTDTAKTAMMVVDDDTPIPTTPPSEPSVPEPDPETQDSSGDGTNPSGSVIVNPAGPLNSPAAIRPTSQTFGVFGAQRVTFYWNEAPGVDGATYTVEVARDFHFTDVDSSMRATGIIGDSCTMMLEPGEYYWRVKAVTNDSKESDWDLSAYSFRVGVVDRDILLIAGIAVCILLIIILLIRAVSFNRRYSRGY